MNKGGRRTRKNVKRVKSAARQTENNHASPEAQHLPLWKKPITWVTGIILAVLTAVATTYGEDLVNAYLNVKAPATAVGEKLGSVEPIEVLKVSHSGPTAGWYLLPNGVSDAALAEWNRSFGTTPTPEWLNRYRAIAIGQSTWNIVLQGTRTQPVQITEMAPVLVGSCDGPVGGTVIDNESAGSGPKEQLFADFDKKPLIFAADIGSSKPFFSDKVITLAKDEEVVIAMTAASSKKHCRWTVRVDYVADGEAKTMTIEDYGRRPFEITAPLKDEQYDYVFLSPLWGCSEPWKRVTGSEFAHLAGGPCPRAG